MAVTALYADESGIHDSAPYCVLAGYLAEPEVWLSFERSWLEAFEPLPAPIKTFHAKCFFPRGGDYLRFAVPEQECVELLDRLLRVIENHDLHAFGIGIDVAYFRSLSWGERAWLTGGKLRKDAMPGGAPSRPYHLCFIHSVFEAERLATPGRTVDFFFARQKQFMGLAGQHFEAVIGYLDRMAVDRDLSEIDREQMIRRREVIGTIAFPPAAEICALQAADLLAYCCYSSFVYRDAMSMERRYAFQRCQKDLQFRGWSPETFERLLTVKLKPEEREILKTLKPQSKKKKGKP